MTTKHRFVPDHVTALVEGVCKTLDLVCVNIRKEGAFSGYFATISDGTVEHEKFLPYDYALLIQAEDRPAFLAGELSALFNLPVAEAVEFVEDVPFEALPPFDASQERESKPQPPTKPRKRAK